MLTENPLRFNVEPPLKYFKMSFVCELSYAVCNGRVSRCCHIEFGSTCLRCLSCLCTEEVGIEPDSMWQHPLTRTLYTAYGNSLTKLI